MTISRAIPALRRTLGRNWRPLLLGAAAAAAAALPPLHLAARIDTALQDRLTRWLLPAAPRDVLLVEVRKRAELASIARAAGNDGEPLVVTTLSHPPAVQPGTGLLGPTEVPLGHDVLRRTDWLFGGHIEFRVDADGRTRSQDTWLDPGQDLPSLPFAAYRLLGDADAGSPRVAQIRFSDPAGYRHLPMAKLTSGGLPDDVRIVVAGAGEPLIDTPVGALPRYELVAQTLQAYRSGNLIRSHPLTTALPWLLTLIALGYMLARDPAARRRWLAAGGAGVASVGAAALAFGAWSISIPLGMPTAALLTATLLLRRETGAAAPDTVGAIPLPEIRAAIAAGDVRSVWPQIQALQADQSSLESLYELGDALERQGYLELAADTFHRAALTDPRYRDVAHRLVSATRTITEAPVDDTDAVTELPETLGRYELLEPIGVGSAGTVFLAIDTGISRLVALKVIDLRRDYDEAGLSEGLERFRREAESAGRLSHPNIVTVFDIGEHASLAYIAMEYLTGRHLSHFCTGERLLPVPLVLDIGARVADALHYAHRRNVVHRDIKPGNIMYDSVSGEVTITDFGIARLIDVSRTRTGVVLGTPSFMAPEQLEGKNVNGHTDLFALGVTLYELLTGRLPFRGRSMTELMFVIANNPHPAVTAQRPDLPPSLDAFFDQALAKLPGDRFDDGATMAVALRALAGQVA